VDAFLALVSRREVRAYDARPLPDDAVRRILEAGRLAGSSRNRQNRRFVVLRDRGRVERAAAAVYNAENLLGATLVVAVVVRGKGPLALDAGRAAQNMLLAAHNEGIGSCPNGIADADAMRAALDLDPDDQVATVLSFGYPPRPRDPRRRTPDEWIERADRLPFDDVVQIL
jgi:nitroreductase